MPVPAARQEESPRVRRALEVLRTRGERVTPARCAVLRVIDEADTADEHLTAEQVGARVAEVEPSIHRATVYRTLTSLTDAGVLSHVHLGGAATVYHLCRPDADGSRPADAATDPVAAHPHDHGHAQCVVCGRVLDVPAEALDGVADRLRSALGFELDTSHAALLGTCADCVARPR
jgi:Fur family ferric uptake transcriptional regulator